MEYHKEDNRGQNQADWQQVFRLALGKLDQIRDLFANGPIPESMVAGMAEPRANVLLSQLEKKAEASGRGKTPSKKKVRARLMK
jgi:hypothetical protein